MVLLDEIQACPDARTAIKFLVEDGRYDYIESGFLLGVRHKEVRSYPVGFEELYQMFPMDLEEYLWANGVQYYPWYMIMFMTAYQAPKEMKYEIDMSALQ